MRLAATEESIQELASWKTWQFRDNSRVVSSWLLRQLHFYAAYFTDDQEIQCKSTWIFGKLDVARILPFQIWKVDASALRMKRDEENFYPQKLD